MGRLQEPDMRTDILDAAEAIVRQHGFNGFHIEDVAASLDMERAEILKHFPNKDDLVRVLAERYAVHFLEQAGAVLRQPGTVSDRIAAYGELFRNSYQDDGKMCLCGILAAEGADIPRSVRVIVADFFRVNIELLEATTQKKQEARLILSSLEGAILLARANENIGPLNDVISDLRLRYV